MRVSLLAFAGLKEMIGADQLPLDLETGATVEDAISNLCGQFPAVSALRPSLRAAINEEYAELDQVLAEGAELALFPPVGGG